jgi:hypothetical protein
LTGQPVVFDCCVTLVAESAALGRTPAGALAGPEPDLVGGIKLDDAPILDNQGDRTVAHALEEPRQLADERLQIVASGRVEACQDRPRGSVCHRNIDEIDRVSRQ